MEYIGVWFRELQDLIKFIFKTDFNNWNRLLNEQTKRNSEFEIITQALGEEIKQLKRKSNKLIEKNAQRIDYETIN